MEGRCRAEPAGILGLDEFDSMSAKVTTSRQKFIGLWRSRFVRSVAVVVSGAAGAQAITMALMPVVTRLYGPEAYGFLGTFMAMLSVAAPIAALAYPIAVVLPKRDEEALGLLRLSAYISVYVATLVAVGLWLSGDVVVALFGMESIGSAVYLLPVAMLFAAWVQMARHWLVRKNAFAVIARSALLHSGLLNSARALAGVLLPSGAVLIVLATLGGALHALLMIIGIRRQTTVSRSSPSEEAEPTALSLARQHADFPLYRAPQNLIHAVSQSLPVLILATFFGPVSAGFYALAKSVVAMPEMLLGSPVMEVFYPRINEAVRNGEDATMLILKATLGVGAMGILPVVVLLVGGGPLFEWVFGGGWATAGQYAQWLALWLLVMLMAKPSIAAIPVFNRQRWLLVYEAVGVVARLAALATGFFVFESDMVSVALFSLVGVSMSIYVVFFTTRIAKSLSDNNCTVSRLEKTSSQTQ